MNPQIKNKLADERTEELPAQEKVASGKENTPAIPAEQVYAERSHEAGGNSQTQGFVP